MDGVLPLEHESRGVHLDVMAVDGQREPLLHHADVDARLPYAHLELRPHESLEIVAMVKVGRADDGSLTLGAVRLGDVIDAILEVGVR